MPDTAHGQAVCARRKRSGRQGGTPKPWRTAQAPRSRSLVGRPHKRRFNADFAFAVWTGIPGFGVRADGIAVARVLLHGNEIPTPPTPVAFRTPVHRPLHIVQKALKRDEAHFVHRHARGADMKTDACRFVVAILSNASRHGVVTPLDELLSGRL